MKSEGDGNGFWLGDVWYPAEITLSLETPIDVAAEVAAHMRQLGALRVQAETLWDPPAADLVEPCILIAQIIDRLLALPYWHDTGATPPPRDELVATLTTAHHDCPHTCNLARIMELDDVGLRHDVLGFYRYTDVERGEFNECGPFWPLSTEKL